MRKVVFFICAITFCSMLSWGQVQTWNLTSTMIAQYSSRTGRLAISTTADSEAIPNFSRENPPPWKSIRSNFGVRIFENVTSIAFVALLLYLVYGSNNKGKNGTIFHSDGTSEKGELTGKGILGERYYKGKDSGKEFVD